MLGESSQYEKEADQIVDACFVAVVGWVETSETLVGEPLESDRSELRIVHEPSVAVSRITAITRETRQGRGSGLERVGWRPEACGRGYYLLVAGVLEWQDAQQQAGW